MTEQAAQDRIFEHAEGYRPGEVSGNLQLDEYEEAYQKLFVEAIEDGVITSDERNLLEKAAQSLGLDPARLEQLEHALSSAYESHHGLPVLRADAAAAAAAAAPMPAAAGGPGEAAGQVGVLRQRVEYLERLLVQMQSELANARAQGDIEVDLSAIDEAAPAEEIDDPVTLHRRLRNDPRDVSTLRALYRSHERHGAHDRQWCTAQALVYLDAADDDERLCFARHRGEGLIQPAQSLDATGWQRHLFHPEDEVITGQIFATIVSAVLLGRVSALRKSGRLPELDPKQLQDPTRSTIQAVRCFSWGASILGMAPPHIYADPGFAGVVEMVPGVPPATRLGKQALSGRLPQQLAFMAGRHLACFREERFLRQLFPDVAELQDLFLAALLIANPALPMDADVKTRVEPVASAVESLLQPVQIDRLRAGFQRFVEHGGRTNLQRWVWAADRTALRAGLLLCDDLGIAQQVLEIDGTPDRHECMDDLLVFCTSERYGKLREQLGIAVSG